MPLNGPDDILIHDYDGLSAEFARRFGKGEYHAGALFRVLYRHGADDPSALPEFAANPSLAAQVSAAFGYRLPEIAGRSGDGETYKSSSCAMATKANPSSSP
jgi:hypothetical protein